jgi:HAD superfamily hydrolase (TIGR01509 family)
MFDCVICGDDVTQGKPAPDIFLEAWGKMGKPPKNQILVFEDSLNGIISATKAGMNVRSIISF